MPRHRRISRLLASGLALAALAVAGGCGQDRITAPATSQAATPASSSLLGGLLGGWFGSGQASLIECPTTETLTANADIDIAGGTVSIGGTRILLPYGAVSSSTPIELTIPASKYMEVEITANHGGHINFLRPVLVTVDYSRCDPEVTTDRLSAWYIDSDTKALLDRMPGIDNKLTRSVTFFTGHLSGYALAN